MDMTPRINAFENKEEFKARLKREGKFDDFIRAREKLKEELGIEGREAWLEAAKLFPPPPEVIESAVELPTAAVPLHELLVDEPNKGETKRIERGLAKEIDEAQAREHAEAEAREAEVEETHWQRMAEHVADKEAPELEAIRWAGANITTNIKRINRDEIPSPLAVNLLRWIRASAANEANFFNNYVPKLLPDRKSLEQDASAMKDDGSEILGAIDRVREARLKATGAAHA